MPDERDETRRGRLQDRRRHLVRGHDMAGRADLQREIMAGGDEVALAFLRPREGGRAASEHHGEQ